MHDIAHETTFKWHYRTNLIYLNSVKIKLLPQKEKKTFLRELHAFCLFMQLFTPQIKNNVALEMKFFLGHQFKCT